MARTIAYWISTVLLAFIMASGGVGELTHAWGTLETVTILGYPLYFVSIIGFWKLLGTVTILAPVFPRLKEWAYAGMFFNMTGAAISHLAVGDYGVYRYHLIVNLGFAALVLASWALRPASRTLAAPIFPRVSRSNASLEPNPTAA